MLKYVPFYPCVIHPQANYKILAARIQNDIYLLTMRLRHTTLRAEFEQTVSERASEALALDKRRLFGD